MASYRSLTATYYPEYAASAHAAAGYIGNGYFDVASPRSLTSIPYDAASQFNRYFDSDKVDCKYNPNESASPKTEFQQNPNQQQHPNSGKDNQQNQQNLVEVVKTEPVHHPEPVTFGTGSLISEVIPGGTDVVVDLQHFVTTTAPTVVATTTATNQLILVRSSCSFGCSLGWLL